MWIGTEANALQALGRASEAAAQFRRTLQLDGGYQPAYANLGLALSGMGRHTEAAATLRQARRRHRAAPPR